MDHLLCDPQTQTFNFGMLNKQQIQSEVVFLPTNYFYNGKHAFLQLDSQCHPSMEKSIFVTAWVTNPHPKQQQARSRKATFLHLLLSHNMKTPSSTIKIHSSCYKLTKRFVQEEAKAYQRKWQVMIQLAGLDLQSTPLDNNSACGNPHCHVIQIYSDLATNRTCFEVATRSILIETGVGNMTSNWARMNPQPYQAKRRL